MSLIGAIIRNHPRMNRLADQFDNQEAGYVLHVSISSSPVSCSISKRYPGSPWVLRIYLLCTYMEIKRGSCANRKVSSRGKPPNQAKLRAPQELSVPIGTLRMVLIKILPCGKIGF